MHDATVIREEDMSAALTGQFDAVYIGDAGRPLRDAKLCRSRTPGTGIIEGRLLLVDIGPDFTQATFNRVQEAVDLWFWGEL